MSFLNRRHPVPEPAERRSFSFKQLAMLAAEGTVEFTGGPVESLTNDAVWACVDLLTGLVADIPVDVVRYVGSRRVPVDPSPVLVSAPSGLVAPDVWRSQVVESMIFDGGAWGLITAWSSTGLPESIELVAPATVRNRRVEKGVIRADVGGVDHARYPHGDLWYVPDVGAAITAGSPFGRSRIEAARKAVKAGLEAQRFGTEFFTAGHPTGMIKVEEVIDEDAANRLRDTVTASWRRRKPAVVGSGVTYEANPVSPTDSQFLPSEQFAIEKVCRFLRVPPTMVYASISGQNVTYSNATQGDLHLLKYSLNRYLRRLESSMTVLLPPGQVLKFNRDAVLELDVDGRNKVFDMRLRNSTLTVNEVRSLNDEAPYGPDFDVPGIPNNGSGGGSDEF